MSILQNEIKFYNDNKQDWIDQGLEGKFVVIFHHNDDGPSRFSRSTHNTFKEAYDTGIESYGNVSVLIQ